MPQVVQEFVGEIWHTIIIRIPSHERTCIPMYHLPFKGGGCGGGGRLNGIFLGQGGIDRFPQLRYFICSWDPQTLTNECKTFQNYAHMFSICFPNRHKPFAPLDPPVVHPISPLWARKDRWC